MNTCHETPCVILGMSVNGLSVARCLGRRGIELIGVDYNKNQPGLYSRYCKPRVCPHSLHQTDAFIDFLIALAEEFHQKPVLIITADDLMRTIADHREQVARHYHFLLHGLTETAAALVDRNMGFRLLEGDPVATLPRFLAAERAALLVTDLDPLRVKRRWKGELCRKLRIPVHEVDGHNVVPVWLASDKKEYGAYTLRPKLHRLLPDFLTDFPELEHHPHGRAEAADIDVERLLDRVQGQLDFEVGSLPPPLLPHIRPARSWPG